MRDCGELVNRIEHRGLVAVTERLEAIAGQLESIGQKKPRKAKEAKAEAAVGDPPVAKAA